MPTIDLFSADLLPEPITECIIAAPLPGLGEGPKCELTANRIMQLEAGTPEKLLAGLWLLAGDLDRSHDFSQNDPSPEGSFWHGIMHRREGDFSNSKYWFRRVGQHPVFERLQRQVGENRQDLPGLSGLLEDEKDLAGSLVDATQNAMMTKEKDSLQVLERVFWWEWQLLFSHCAGVQAD